MEVKVIYSMNFIKKIDVTSGQKENGRFRKVIRKYRNVD